MATGRTQVLYVHHSGDKVGGSAVSLRFQLAALDRLKFAPSLAVLRSSRRASPFTDLGVPLCVMPHVHMYNHTTGGWYSVFSPFEFIIAHIRMLLSLFFAYRFFRHSKPDVVHLNSITLWPVAWAARRHHIPVVVHVREHLADGHFGLRRHLISRAIRRYASHVIAICQADLDRFGEPFTSADVIYNFVDFGEFDRHLCGSEVRRELGVRNDESVIAFLGGIRPIKGTLEYLRAARIVSDNRPNVRFLLIGARSRFFGKSVLNHVVNRILRPRMAAYFDRVSALIGDLTAGGRLVDLGPRTDVPSLLAASDVVVFPSTVPHFARPLIEAAAMAKPSVASDLDGPRETIVDGVTGMLVPPGDTSALAAAITSLVDSPAHARQMGEAAYLRAKDLYAPSEAIRRIEAIYDKLVAGRRDQLEMGCLAQQSEARCRCPTRFEVEAHPTAQDRPPTDGEPR